MEPLATPGQYLLIVSLIACAIAVLAPLACWLDARRERKNRRKP